MNEEKSNFSGIDLFKLIFAVFVVFIHTDFFSLEKGEWAFDIIYPMFLRLAVPYFFVASGFFFYRKCFYDGFDIKKYLRRLCIKLIVFEPISLLIYGCINLYKGKSISWIILWAGRSVLFYPVGALWYIQALIVAILIIYPFIKRDRIICLFPIALILYFAAALTNRYYFLVESTPLQKITDTYNLIFASGRNGLMYGLLFVLIGCAISKYCKSGGYKRVLIPTLILCYMAGFIEVYLIHGLNGNDDWAIHFSHIFIVPVLFIATLSLNVLSKKASILMRNISTSIYLLHSPLLQIVRLAYKLITGYAINPILLFIITMFIIGLICTIVYIRKKQPFYDLLR